MDYTETIYVEVEGSYDSGMFSEYLTKRNIEFEMTVEDYKFVGEYYIYRFNVTKEQLEEMKKLDYVMI